MKRPVTRANYASQPPPVFTSADRIAANSRSDSELPFFRPISIGRQNNCRNAASESKIPGFTNSASANNSYVLRQTR